MIKIKSLKDPVDSEVDGLRILIARYRPQGLPKAEENWDQYIKEGWKNLAPSVQLHRDTRAYRKKHNNDISSFWPEYVRRFTSEIRNNPKALQALERLHNYDSNDGIIITLLCHCENENLCHRSLVRQMIADKFWLLPVEVEIGKGE